MNEQQRTEDVKAAHAVFNLCGIRKTNRGTTPLSLRMRALMLAEQAGINLTQEQVSAEMQNSTSSNPSNSN
jgi:hypothetical protein